MKEGRDISLVYHINKHYKDIEETMVSIHSLSEFSNAGNNRKGIILDLIQIGELCKNLSKGFVNDLKPFRLYDVVDFRNALVHGYEKIIDKKVYSKIKNNLPNLVKKLNAVAEKRYTEKLKDLLGKTAVIYIDRRNKNSTIAHIKDLKTFDDEFQIVRLNWREESDKCDVVLDSIKEEKGKYIYIGKEI